MRTNQQSELQERRNRVKKKACLFNILSTPFNLSLGPSLSLSASSLASLLHLLPPSSISLTPSLSTRRHLLSSDMDKENLAFPHHFASPYSTESESDDEDVVALTHRFSRSASFTEPLSNNLKEKRVFSGSPESTLGWLGSVHSQPPSLPPFVRSDEDAWNMIYAAAGQVARMKMRMSLNNRGLPGVVPYCDGEEFFRQQQSCRNRCVSGSESVGGGCGGRPPSFPPTAWPPPQQRIQHRSNQQKPCNAPVMKRVVIGGSGGGCDGGGATAAKRECPGTGVFLPRRYCNNPPESRKRQACSPANLPAKTIQYSNNTLVPINGQPQTQARINVDLIPHYEMLMGRRNAMSLAAQQLRSNIHGHGGVMESPVNNPEMLLPQEWTY
ncbi:unnamed protein product [Lactuca saligna]|uniref:Uncharacterized protein n=1 Tax=Lactuca saligna TaxID=75948 RepID=A0AA36EGV8_LACSI|nr:unnamed protein product [Lactuca saligna]